MRLVRIAGVTFRPGSSAAAVSAPGRVVMVKPSAGDTGIEELVHLIGEDYDIILAEGFKYDSAPKIEVHRKEIGPLLEGVSKVIAIATDEPLDTRVRQFALDNIKELADFLEGGFIGPQQERILAYVNGEPVPLTSYPKKIITRTLVAMFSTLKGVSGIRSLEIFMKQTDEDE